MTMSPCRKLALETAAAVAVIASAAACSLSKAGSTNGGDLPGSAPSTGTIVGTLEMVGGPPGANPEPVPGYATATRDGGRSFPVKEDGRFRIELTPGTYQLTGRNALFNNGKAIAAMSRPSP
jgi:hypothetical protein